jgi:hypothetical protein
MPSQLDHVTAKILELNITLVAAADTLAVDSAKFYFSRQKQKDSDGYTVPVVGGAAGTSPKEIELGSVLPPPTVIRFVFANF